MQSLVISLKTAIERRQHIEHQFASKGVNFQFFDALTPEKAKPLAEKMSLIVKNECLTSGELACFMSHVSIWQKIVDEKIPYLAIFEDDIFLGEEAASLLNKSDWIHENWHIIKIEAFDNKILVYRSGFPILNGERNIFQLKNKNLGTAGYILSLKGASTYLKYIMSHPLKPLDEMMFDHFINEKVDNVYQLNPALCIQEMKLYANGEVTLSSGLLRERNNRMIKNKVRGLQKIKREMIRLYINVKKMFFAINNDFK